MPVAFSFVSVVVISFGRKTISTTCPKPLRVTRDGSPQMFVYFCATDEGKKVLAEWKKLASYVVGLSTSEAAQNLGLKPLGEESGSAEKLAEFIVGGQSKLPLERPRVKRIVRVREEDWLCRLVERLRHVRASTRNILRQIFPRLVLFKTDAEAEWTRDCRSGQNEVLFKRRVCSHRKIE